MQLAIFPIHLTNIYQCKLCVKFNVSKGEGKHVCGTIMELNFDSCKSVVKSSNKKCDLGQVT